MDYKIVFFDVDGTLVNYEDGRIVESTMIAIEQLKKQWDSSCCCYRKTFINVPRFKKHRYRYVYYR